MQEMESHIIANFFSLLLLRALEITFFRESAEEEEKSFYSVKWALNENQNLLLRSKGPFSPSVWLAGCGGGGYWSKLECRPSKSQSVQPCFTEKRLLCIFLYQPLHLYKSIEGYFWEAYKWPSLCVKRPGYSLLRSVTPWLTTQSWKLNYL